MIFIYTLIVVILATIAMVVNRRASALANKYSRMAGEVEKLSFAQLVLREGNSSKPDSVATARRQYLLGQMVLKRDQLETKWQVWQARADRLHRWQTALREWKGRKLPYIMGALDVSGALYLIDYFGVGQYLSIHNLVQMLASWIG